MLEEALGRLELRLTNSDDFDAGDDRLNALCGIRKT
jgi:hypothetical protein